MLHDYKLRDFALIFTIPLSLSLLRKAADIPL